VYPFVVLEPEQFAEFPYALQFTVPFAVEDEYPATT
jgi:hypothetical protein